MRRFSRSYRVKPTPPPKDVRLVYFKPVGPGEDAIVYATDILHPDIARRINAGEAEVFDPARHDRGPEVKCIATLAKNEDSVWYPKTSGTYCLELTETTDGRSWNGLGLGFGTRSQPMHTRAQLHRLYLSTIERHPALLGRLRCVKVPAIFTKDHPDAPGGATVVLSLDDLPEPTSRGVELPRTYM